jgi:hypothetical protein
MTNLIDDLFNDIPKSGDVRDYKGYQQHRETLKAYFNKRGNTFFRITTPWMFTVQGFQDQTNDKNNTCFVVDARGSLKEVPIDDKGRITIDGKKYSNWVMYRDNLEEYQPY